MVKRMTIDVYRKLQENFDTFPMRFPPTETGVEIQLLKKLFTPEEAISLLVKDNSTIPPLTTVELFSNIGEARKKAESDEN